MAPRPCGHLQGARTAETVDRTDERRRRGAREGHGEEEPDDPAADALAQVEQDLDEVPDREDGEDGRGTGLEQGQRLRVPGVRRRAPPRPARRPPRQDEEHEVGRIPRAERQPEDRDDDGRDRPTDDELRQLVEPFQAAMTAPPCRGRSGRIAGPPGPVRPDRVRFVGHRRYSLVRGRRPGPVARRRRARYLGRSPVGRCRDGWADGRARPRGRRGLAVRWREAARVGRRTARPPACPRRARRGRDRRGRRRPRWGRGGGRGGHRLARREARREPRSGARAVELAPGRLRGACPPTADAVLVALGDQPLVPVETIRALLRRPVTAGPAGRRPGLRGGAGPEPRPAAPGRVRSRRRDRRATAGSARSSPRTRNSSPRSPRRGTIPTWIPSTISPPSSRSAWATRVRANREQVERIREVPDGTDFYAPVTSLFRADPTRHRRSGPRRPARPRPVRRHVAGRRSRGRPVRAAAGPRARPVGRVGRRARHVALDARGAARDRRGLRHRERPGRRGALAARTTRAPPARSGRTSRSSPTSATTSRTSGRSSRALEDAADRLCVAVLMERVPASAADPFWPPVHGEERVGAPGAARGGRDPRGARPPPGGRAGRRRAPPVRVARCARGVRPPPAVDRPGRGRRRRASRRRSTSWPCPTATAGRSRAAAEHVGIVTWAPR